MEEKLEIGDIAITINCQEKYKGKLCVVDSVGSNDYYHYEVKLVGETVSAPATRSCLKKITRTKLLVLMYEGLL